MLLNDLLGMLMEVPPMLASQWAVWFVVGLVLSIWGRREKTWVHAPATSRHKSDMHATPARPSFERAHARAQQGAGSTGDAFAELEALLEQPAGFHRTPGDSSHLAESDAPGAQLLAAPQSLP